MTFYFAYAGNKRNELKNIEELINLDLYDNIVEPFGGSCSFSRNIYEKDNSKNFYISDINNELVYFCNNFYKNKDDTIKECLQKINNINTKEEYNVLIKNLKKYDLKDYLIYQTYYRLRKGYYPIDNRKPKFIDYNKKTDKIDLFFKNVKYVNQSFKIYLDQFKDDEKTLIFLDPPYIDSCNDFYEGDFNSKDMYNIWEDIYDFVNNCKCKFIMIVNNNVFMKIIFKNFYYNSYEKKYSSHSKKQVSHIVFTNILNK